MIELILQISSDVDEVMKLEIHVRRNGVVTEAEETSAYIIQKGIVDDILPYHIKHPNEKLPPTS